MKYLPLIISLCLFCGVVSAQSGQTYEQARAEIEASFGTVPSFLEAIPEHALPGMWGYLKATTSEESAIPPKYRELIQLAVAAQIPCDYCIYYHTESAKAFGATEQEIQEAIMDGASTRSFSMILQGNQIELEEFKKEFQQMMAYMAEQAGN